MREDDASDPARRHLASLQPSTKAAADLKEFLLHYVPRSDQADDLWAWLACALALEAVTTGNFGVGAVLVDATGLLVQGHNELIHPRFRSDRHAEMVVMDRWEDAAAGTHDLTLFTSVEPCPMCLVRLSSSAVKRVRHVAPDGPGGMVHRREGLPPFWREVARGKDLGQARCSDDLVRAANEIFLLNLAELTARLGTG